MQDSKRRLFYGNGQRQTVPHADSPTTAEPYIVVPGLVQAINLAIHVGRPLLLEGEAGCGKTRLAPAVAYELGLPFYSWHVRSTSKAIEGLYSYDAILRLHDVQIRQFGSKLQDGVNGGQVSINRDPGNPRDYRKLGPLGKAFTMTDCPAVVLIDEIDKADIDFPNDLLAVLDEPWEFEIPETGEKIKAEQKPIVVITSNKEKGNLPFPFLRRCIYYFVEFPNEPTLKRIVEEHYKFRDVQPAVELIHHAAQRFFELRNEGNLLKAPSTSEFLDWVNALHSFDEENRNGLDSETLQYPSLLFKLRPDWQRYCKVV